MLMVGCSVGVAAVGLARAAMDGAGLRFSPPAVTGGFYETLGTAAPIHHLGLPELVVKSFFLFAIFILFWAKKYIIIVYEFSWQRGQTPKKSRR